MGHSLKVWLAEIQTGIASKLYQCGKYSHLETRCQCGQYSHLWAHGLPVLSELSSCLPSKWLPLLQFSTQGSPLFVCGSPLFQHCFVKSISKCFILLDTFVHKIVILISLVAHHCCTSTHPALYELVLYLETSLVC